MMWKLALITIIASFTYYLIGKYLENKNIKTPIKRKKTNELDVTKKEFTFDELSLTMWMKHEAPNTYQASEEEIAETYDICPDFTNQTSVNFWNVIVPYYRWLEFEERQGFTKLIDVFTELLIYLDMPENSHLSSVSGQYTNKKNEQYIDNEAKEFEVANTYDIFAQVNILEHTLGVAEHILRIVCSKGHQDECKGKIGNALLVALAHDLGKIERQKNLNEKRPHEVVSVDMFVKKVKNRIPYENMEEIQHAILKHHSGVNADNTGFLVNALIKADRMERAKELKKHLYLKDFSPDFENVFVENVEETIRKEILRCIIKPTKEEMDFIIFDKNKGALIYIDSMLLSKFKEKMGISDELFQKSLVSLRKQHYIMLIDFSKFQSYRLSIKYKNGDVLQVDVFPIDYTKFALTLLEVQAIYQDFEMPKLA